MAIANLVPALRQRASRHRIFLAALTVSVLVVVGSTTAVAVSAQASAEEQARVEAAAAEALEQEFIDYYLGAIERLQPHGKQLVDDAAGLAASASPLLTSADVSAIENTVDSVSDSLARTPAPDATSAELEQLFDSQWAMIAGARERFGVFVAAATAAAKVHLDAAPIADGASRQALVDAMSALESASKQHASIAEPFTALTASAAAVDAAQAAAVVAAAAAAAAAAVKRGGVAPRPGSPAATGSPEPVCSGGVLACTNALRAYYGVGSLSTNGALTSAAQACAQRMSDAGVSPPSHSSPTPGFGWWGENIAWGYGSETSVFNGWKNSPGHFKNLVRPQFTQMGLAVVGTWWCQQFGS